MFEELDAQTYEGYLSQHPFLLSLNVGYVVDNDRHQPNLIGPKSQDRWHTVNPRNQKPFDLDLGDLIRLHYLVTSRKVTSVLEFGVGASTAIFDHALKENKRNHANFVDKNLRISNPFVCHSVDDSKKWIRRTRSFYNTEVVNYHYSKVRMSAFNDRICTYYDSLPNICPDLIYLDAPNQFSAKGNVRGISTRDPNRLPMSADILSLEHHLLPGTLIVVDGRTANARFLKANLQRDWQYRFIQKYDQHFFELAEQPLGPFSAAEINFKLGASF